MPDGSKKQIPQEDKLDDEEWKDIEKIIGEKSVLRMSKIRTNFWEEEISKFNT